MRLPRIGFTFYVASLLILTANRNPFVHSGPQSAGGAAFAIVGNNFYIQGGAISGDSLLQELWALDLTKSWTTSNPAWITLANGPSNGYHSAGYSADNKSFITFGRDTAARPSEVPLSWVNIYDIPSGSWNFQTNPANLADNSRRDFSVVTNPSANKIYILGGDSTVNGTKYNNVFDTFDPVSRTLTEITTPVPGPQNISTYSGVWVPRLNAMMVIGGSIQNSAPQGLYLYRPDTGAWTIQATTGSFTYARRSPCAASNADGSLVAVYGGFTSDSGAGDPYVFILDTETWAWTNTSYPGRGRGSAACAIVDNTFLIWGGFYSTPNTGWNNGAPSGVESLLLFSLSNKTWQTTYTPSPARSRNPTGGNDSNPGKMSAAAIGGIVVGSIAVIAALALAFLDQRRKRRRLEKKSFASEDGSNDTPNVTERHHQLAPPRPLRPKSTNYLQLFRPTSEDLLDPRGSAEGGDSSIGHTTPTSLQFLATSENGGGSESAHGRQSNLSDSTCASVYYPPPPPIQRQSLSEVNSASKSDANSARRPHNPHSIIGPGGYYPYSNIAIIEPVADQYHEAYGMKHISAISSQTGHSDISSTYPQISLYDPRLPPLPPPPIPKRPVSGPQCGN
ncbi:hypothetical protein BGX21_005930 [Mortierella sp. AD011]|nr:hypothetical protein BGX20_006561 [Mortierella sp. AD010]KAF9399597.1 hypothetical protein BGX21_005930 [Mortierella sp. AD011]